MVMDETKREARQLVGQRRGPSFGSLRLAYRDPSVVDMATTRQAPLPRAARSC